MPAAGWHRELQKHVRENVPHDLSPRRVLYSRGTPGIVSRSRPRQRGAVKIRCSSSGRQARSHLSRLRRYPRQGTASGVSGSTAEHDDLIR